MRGYDLLADSQYQVSIGVAYSHTKQNPNPRVVQSWPGKPIDRNNKVPSSIVYWSAGPMAKTVKCWDFQSQNFGDTDTKEWFKRFPDPARITELKETARKKRVRRALQGMDVLVLPEDDVSDHDEVKRYYKDYMHSMTTRVQKSQQRPAIGGRSVSSSSSVFPARSKSPKLETLC